MLGKPQPKRAHSRAVALWLPKTYVSGGGAFRNTSAANGSRSRFVTHDSTKDALALDLVELVRLPDRRLMPVIPAHKFHTVNADNSTSNQSIV